MKVSVKEEPAWKRVLDVTVEADVVAREMDRVVAEMRRSVSLPGFRKGKVPAEIIFKAMGDDVQSAVLKRILPQAFEDALEDASIRPIGDPRISNLRFARGEPLTFTATVEIHPQVAIQGYEGLRLTKEIPPIPDEKLNRILDNLREERAELEEVDRPAQNSDVVVVRYYEIDDQGGRKGEEDPVELSLEVGSPSTPETFNRELFGAVTGDMKKIPLPYPQDYPNPELAGTTRLFHVTVAKVQEKIWPPLDDALARAVLGDEQSTLVVLKERILKNLEAEAEILARRDLERRLIGRLLELNPFELPREAVEGALDRILEAIRKDHPGLPPDEEVRIREQYRPRVEADYKVDLLLEAVGKQEQIEVPDEDLDKAIADLAENEKEEPARLKARLKKERKLERLRDDLFRRRVVDRLLEKADVTVAGAGLPDVEGEA